MKKNDSKEDEPSNFPKFFNNKNSYKNKSDEMLKIIKKSQKEDLISNDQESMIEKILELETTSVIDIMVHRIDIKAVEKNSKTEDVLALYVKTNFSKVLIYEDDIDKIIGVVNYVIVDNTKRGYGIFITKMLEEGDKIVS